MKIVRNTSRGFSINPYYSASLDYDFDDVYYASDSVIRLRTLKVVLPWSSKEGDIGNKVLFYSFERKVAVPYFIFWDKEFICTVRWEIQDTFPGKCRIKIDVVVSQVSKRYYDSVHTIVTALKDDLVKGFYSELKRTEL